MSKFQIFASRILKIIQPTTSSDLLEKGLELEGKLHKLERRLKIEERRYQEHLNSPVILSPQEERQKTVKIRKLRWQHFKGVREATRISCKINRMLKAKGLDWDDIEPCCID